ncbi:MULTISPECIES: NusG domain II-containing protein [unclassified Fusibacter]|uniref:NusG domain II-containing protein n=1 Tax=unclassified Fusibacter TaxID=2624464 RepID=UPI0010128E01|nr:MULTISPECIES: NusG domain II-containing protein [unclassified Fusibacter]MCK8058288.1 NusG domain II-containing protein [Fusibacter sp. A2]NPE20871.1 NusG domain II-containing protein [Fusibacter sp. A1]RXV63075.1 NusG domain II-containing protein [Fusibacter sp. A1]
MKKGDIIIIIAAILLAAALYLGFDLLVPQDGQREVVIKSEGVEVTRLAVDATTSASYTVENSYGDNTIYVEGLSVHMHEASCKNQVCVTDGEIDKIGQSLVCLPNRVTVEIVGKQDEEPEVDGVSY